ncbi:hypothetical protein MPER_04279, partial [Moniliophthora perniciosa FA553]
MGFGKPQLTFPEFVELVFSSRGASTKRFGRVHGLRKLTDIIIMDLEKDIGKAGRNAAVAGICDILKLEKPSSEKIQEGIDVALGYKVKTRTKRDEMTPKEKTRTPRYYALLPEMQVEKALEKILGSSDDTYTFWMHLKQNDRITKRPHVTLVHEKSLPEQIELWERSAALHQMNVPPMFELKLGSVVWDERVMAISVDDVKFVEEKSNPMRLKRVQSSSANVG